MCTDGQEKNVGTCEKCGSLIQTCVAGAWRAAECKNQKTCEAKTSESESCGNCGRRTRTCSSSCTWGVWSTCEPGGVCTPNTTQQEACGNCGKRSRTCSSSCTWGSWSSCTGGGECSPNTTQHNSCGNCGTTTRTCSSSCTWGAWSACTGQGVCTPGATEDCCTTNKGITVCCKIKRCGSSCTWGACALKDGMECDWNRGLKCRTCGGSGYYEWCWRDCKWTRNCEYCPGCCNVDEPEIYYSSDLPEIGLTCE